MKIRIEWTICDKSGHGAWHEESAKPALDEWCKTMNMEFGAGSHRIVKDSAGQPSDQ